MSANHARNVLDSISDLWKHVRDLEGSRAAGAQLASTAWASYPVEWHASGTAPSLGNGTLSGYYVKHGRLTTARIMLNSGSLTTFGSGFYWWTLPFAAAVTGVPAGQFAQCGSMVISTGGSANFYTAAAFIAQSLPGQVNGLVNNSGSFLGATNPATFSGSGCQFQISITYESAS